MNILLLAALIFPTVPAASQAIAPDVLASYCELEDGPPPTEFTATGGPFYIEVGGAKVDIELKELRCRNKDRSDEGLDLIIMYHADDKNVNEKIYTSVLSPSGAVAGYLFFAPVGDGRGYMHDVRGFGVEVRMTTVFQEGKTGPDAVSGAKLELFDGQGRLVVEVDKDGNRFPAVYEYRCSDQPCRRVP